jgi:hypothetical protein
MAATKANLFWILDFGLNQKEGIGSCLLTRLQMNADINEGGKG